MPTAVKRRTSPKRRSPVKRRTSPKRRSPVKRKTSPKRRRKTSRKRLNPPPHGYTPFLNKEHFEAAYAKYASRFKYTKPPMTKPVFLKLMKEQDRIKTQKRIKEAQEKRNAQEVMRKIRADQLKREKSRALDQRLKDIRNPPTREELARRDALNQKIARSLPSTPTKPPGGRGGRGGKKSR